MRAETRFVGNGNTWVANGHYRGWQVTCSQCGAVKTVTSHHGSSLPPDAIVKALLKSGWHIGRKPEDDLCVSCKRKPKPVIKPVATKPWTTPFEYFEHLRHCLNLAKQSIEAKRPSLAIGFINDVRDLLMPAVTVRMLETVQPVTKSEPEPKTETVEKSARKPEPPPSESDEEYRKWLAQLSKPEIGGG